MPEPRYVPDDQSFLAQALAAALRADGAVVVRSDEENLPAQVLRALRDKLPEEARSDERRFDLGDDQVVVVKQGPDGSAYGALGVTGRAATETTHDDVLADENLLADVPASGDGDPLDDVSAAVKKMRRLPF